MVNDGNRDVPVELRDATMTVRRTGGVLKLDVIQPSGVKLALVGPRIAMHNGYYRAAAADLPANVRSVEWNATLEPAPPATRPVSASRP
jgi:hypothetical protein